MMTLAIDLRRRSADVFCCCFACIECICETYFFKHVKCIYKFMHFFGSVNGALVNSEDPDKMPKYVRYLVGLLS